VIGLQGKSGGVCRVCTRKAHLPGHGLYTRDFDRCNNCLTFYFTCPRSSYRQPRANKQTEHPEDAHKRAQSPTPAGAWRLPKLLLSFRQQPTFVACVPRCSMPIRAHDGLRNTGSNKTQHNGGRVLGSRLMRRRHGGPAGVGSRHS
jgi:hypothetical protein